LTLLLFSVQKTAAFEQRLYSHPLHDSSQLEDTYSRYHEKLKVSVRFLFKETTSCEWPFNKIHLLNPAWSTVCILFRKKKK